MIKGVSSWTYSPFRLPYEINDKEIYISRLAPYDDHVEISFFPIDKSTHKQYKITLKNGDDIKIFNTNELFIDIKGLKINEEYSFKIESQEYQSETRLFRTGKVPGVIINYLHPDDDYYIRSGHYLGSPSIIRTKDNSLLASIDIFGDDTSSILTLVYRSSDEGKSWNYVNELCPCFWGQLFTLNDDVYMFAVTGEYGDLVIGKSTDNGNTFGLPTILLRGSSRIKTGGPHKNAMRPLIVNNRIYFAIECGSWHIKKYFGSIIASCDIRDNLLDASNWTFSDPYFIPVKPGEKKGMIEGNLVYTNGKLLNILRSEGEYPKIALALEVNTKDLTKVEVPFDSVKLDSYNSKFEINKNEDGIYYCLGTYLYEDKGVWDRRIISLWKSDDGLNYTKLSDILDIRDKCLTPDKDGLQYPSFIFSGNDIYWLCRVALNNANTFHNSNYITFNIIKNYKEIK